MDADKTPDGAALVGAQTIRRAIEVVRIVAQLQRSGATLARVARASGLPRATTFRMLRILAHERLLTFSERERSYWIGPLTYELGLAAAPRRQPQDDWREAVEQVARETRLTSYLIGRSGSEAVCLLCVQGTTAIRAMPVEVGQRMPLGYGAGSLAILASLDDSEIAAIVANRQSTPDVFPGDRQKAPMLLERVAAARDNGYSLSVATVAAGVSGVGVLVPQDPLSIPLAITVSAVTENMSIPEAEILAQTIKRAILARCRR